MFQILELMYHVLFFFACVLENSVRTMPNKFGITYSQNKIIIITTHFQNEIVPRTVMMSNGRISFSYKIPLPILELIPGQPSIPLYGVIWEKMGFNKVITLFMASGVFLYYYVIIVL